MTQTAQIAQVRQALLRRPQMIDTRRASLRLVAKREKCTAAAAMTMLGELGQANVIVDLYKASMPEEFKRERGSRMSTAKHFWRRLGFPIYEDHLHHLIEHEEEPQAFGIPIAPLGGHICSNCYNFADMPTSYQLAILLMNPEYVDDDDPEMAAEDWTHLAKRYQLEERIKPGERIDVARFETAVAQLRSPLRYLPLLVRAIDYNTGCIFFDFDPQEGWPDDIGWTPQNIVWLRREYKLAQEIQTRIESIDEWFETKRAERIVEALALYHRIKGNRIATKRKRTHKGKPLVGVL